MRAWFLVGWAVAAAAAWGCGPSEVLPTPDSPDDDLSDAPVFVRFDARPRADASVFDARPVVDGDVEGEPDAPVGHPEPDAPVVGGDPDAPDTGPTLTFDPPEAFVAVGGTATIRVVLDTPAAQSTSVVLATSGTEASVPTSVLVPAGQTTATVTVTGLTLGTVSVTSGGDRALIHVVPPITSIDPAGPTDFRLGKDLTLTITLEEGSDVAVPISLVIDDTSVVTGAGVSIPAGQTSVTVSIHGAGLGVTDLHALIGDGGADATVRVNGIFLSEILYDYDKAQDGGNEWVELFNDTTETIDLSTIALSVATHPPFMVFSAFSDSMAPGECAVFFLTGAPTDGALGNGTNGDGIRLQTLDGQALDEVIYGDNNSDGIPDENDDVPDSPDVADVDPGKTIARDFDSPGFPWGTPAAPSPADCTNF